MRKSPVKHTVHRHTRSGKPVRTYNRGSRFLENRFTKKLIALRSTPIVDKNQPPHTPSGRLTDNLCKVAKDQTLVWEGKEGSQRIVLGHYRSRMKHNRCELCGEFFQEKEPIVMAQDYFPFRSYFPTYGTYHPYHFPFKLDDLVQAEKEIDKYMNATHKRPDPFKEGDFYERENDIYQLEHDVRQKKFS